MNFKDKWNKNKFSVYDSEEKTVLRMLQNMYNYLSEFASALDNKTDLNGDHKGSWQGLEKPTLSEEGMRATVEKLDKDYYKLLSNKEGRLNIMDFEGDTKEEKFINAINYTQNTIVGSTGIRPTLFIPNGEYDFEGYITSGFVIDNLEYPISLVGESAEGVILNYSKALVSEEFLKIKNGSGTLRQNTIENITFIGNDTTTCVIFENTCGTKFKNCIIGENLYGGQFNNVGEGGFTEWVGFKDCQFLPSCEVVLQYNKVGSEISFHGTGLENCLINQDSTSTRASIEINNGAFPYNAPLDFTIWTRGDRPIISNYSGSNSVNFYGNINVEPFNDGDVFIVDKTGSGVMYNGTLSSNNSKVKLGWLNLCTRIQVNSDLSVNADISPYTIKKSIPDYKNEILVMSTCETKLVDIQLRTGNYEMQHTVIASPWLGSNSGTATVIASTREFDNVGIGVPVYFVQDNRLFVEGNFEGKDVTLYAKVTQIGSRTEYFME